MLKDKLKIYPVGYSIMKIRDNKLLELIIEKNNFAITENIEEIKDYCYINKIPIVKNLYEMCNIRKEIETIYDLQFRGI